MATSGPNSGGTFANVDLFGGTGWTNPSNAASSNNSYATFSFNDDGQSQMLTATNFGFSIPTGATIDGIVAEVERKISASQPSVRDNYVALTKDGTTDPGGDGKQDAVTDYPTSDGYATYGGAADLWSLTWTAEEINATGFGLFFATMGGDSETVSVDHIRITVYYTPAAGGGIPRGPFSKPFRGPFGGSIGW